MTSTEQVVAAILRRDDRVLLCHRHPGRVWYPDVWDLPGGHVDDGEEAASALVRELAEELGIQVAMVDLSLWTILHAPTVEMAVFVLDSWAGEPRNRAPDEHDEIRWVSIKEASGLELAHPSYPKLLARALRR